MQLLNCLFIVSVATDLSYDKEVPSRGLLVNSVMVSTCDFVLYHRPFDKLRELAP